MSDEYEVILELEPDGPVDYMVEFLTLAYEAEADDNASDEAKRMARNVLRDGEVRH